MVALAPPPETCGVYGVAIEGLLGGEEICEADHAINDRSRSGREWIRTTSRRTSSGRGIRLAGRRTAAAPHASPSARPSLPRAPAARNPSSRAAPAPTVLLAPATGASPIVTPSSSTSTAPSAPRLASTLR